MSDPQPASGPLCDTLLIGVTGSVGVLSVPAYVKQLRQMLARDVYVLMSGSAQKFVTPYSFALYSGHDVFCDSFERHDSVNVPHVQLARRADLFVIMPATAHVIARCAHGIGDDLITTTVLACEAPVVFVPSMNEAMWRNAAVQENVRRLREFGHDVLEPAVGYEIADLRPTFGVMPRFPELLEALTAILERRRSERRAAGNESSS